jgi:hypothetical protein
MSTSSTGWKESESLPTSDTGSGSRNDAGAATPAVSSRSGALKLFACIKPCPVGAPAEGGGGGGGGWGGGCDPIAAGIVRDNDCCFDDGGCGVAADRAGRESRKSVGRSPLALRATRADIDRRALSGAGGGSGSLSLPICGIEAVAIYVKRKSRWDFETNRNGHIRSRTAVRPKSDTAP